MNSGIFFYGPKEVRKMKTKRCTKNKIKLRKGEYQRKNKTFEYRWNDINGKTHCVYAKSLSELRDKEDAITRDILDGIDYSKLDSTIDSYFELWKKIKTGIRETTYATYVSFYERYIAPEYGKTRIKDVTYSRVEHHKYMASQHRVIVTNLAFKSTARGGENDLGQEISLTAIPEWADIEPTTTIDGVDRLLFAYFKMPEANTIDIYSPLGVSGFDKAKSLIKDADIQYSRLLWEYEGGELAIDIDKDALRDYYTTDSQGNRVLKSSMGKLQQRLYRPVDLSAEGDTYNQYAPALRDASYISGLNTILMHIEDVTGLSRGTLSQVDVAEARTATELRILKQRSYQTNAEIQKAIQKCLDDTIYVMNVLCSLYDITPEGEYEVSYEWDDSILVDKNEELGRNITLMDKGIMSKKELRMWYKGETEKQAREALLEVQEENRLAVEDNIMTQMDFNQQGLDSSLQQSPDNFRGNE